jgi:hypothetical protein
MISQTMLLDFIKTAQGNGITNLSAYLPRNHPLILSNQVRQIRKPNDALVQGFDELGNRVILTTQGTVLQLD